MSNEKPHIINWTLYPRSIFVDAQIVDIKCKLWTFADTKRGAANKSRLLCFHHLHYSSWKYFG